MSGMLDLITCPPSSSSLIISCTSSGGSWVSSLTPSMVRQSYFGFSRAMIIRFVLALRSLRSRSSSSLRSCSSLSLRRRSSSSLTTSRMPCTMSSNASSCNASSCVGHLVTGLPSVGRTLSLAKGAPFQSVGRRMMGMTRT